MGFTHCSLQGVSTALDPHLRKAARRDQMENGRRRVLLQKHGQVSWACAAHDWAWGGLGPSCLLWSRPRLEEMVEAPAPVPAPMEQEMVVLGGRHVTSVKTSIKRNYIYIYIK